MFERIPDEQVKDDVGVKAMREETDEAQKVIRNGGQIWHAVFRKRAMDKEEDKNKIEKDVLDFFM